jgi:hypothetical protein
LATSLSRRVVGALSTLLVATVTVAGLASPAHAEDGYRYWNYFHLEGDTWTFSEVGPADYQPEEGDVEGFRFGTSTVSQGIEPRADLAEVNFDTICAETEAGADEKRVAVVLDYGAPEDQGTPPEPRAECAVVAQDASTQQVLGEVAEVRLDSGMTCAFDGYPASGCGEPVKNAEVATDEEPVAFVLPAGADDEDASAETEAVADESNPWPLVGLVALVVVIAGAALLLVRRRKSA